MALAFRSVVGRVWNKLNTRIVKTCRIRHRSNFVSPLCDPMYSPCQPPGGVIVGVYQDKSGDIKLDNTGRALNEKLDGTLRTCLLMTKPIPKSGEVRLFTGLHPVYTTICVVGLGDECAGFNAAEQIDEKKELIRTGVGAGVKALLEIDFSRLLVGSFGHAESAAEGASMASWMYQEFKTIKNRKKIPRIELFNSNDFTGWQIGLHKAAAQNLTRHLQEAPANHLTPQTFAQSAIELLSKYSINIEVRMKQWAKLRNLNAFLAAGSGTCDPIFLELFYEGCNPNKCPIVLIGKGVTFNSGGLCLKSEKQMADMRGDMVGAAAIVATLRAVASLQLPINVRGLIPMCARTPGPTSVKPGDTVRAYNGKTILVENTNCDGLLMHADALSYAKEYCPKFILDVGTLTEDAYGALGQSASLVFSNNESLFEMMRIASMHTGDRVWRFPLWNYFGEYMKTPTSDLTNKAPRMVGGGSAKATAFLREFVPPHVDWIHLEVQNVFTTNGVDNTYLREGMSGRPTRNLIEFLAQLACNHEY